jgi:hypothetical protein
MLVRLLSTESRQHWLTQHVMSTYIDTMSDGVQLAQEASSRDPAVGLRAVRALRELAERLEALQVAHAREQGWSWQDIAVCLGVSRQAVHKKHSAGRRILSREK